MFSKQEAALSQARAEFSKEKAALQAQHLEALGAFEAQLAKLTQDSVKLAELKEENEAMSREFGEQREHILQLIRDDEFKESLFDMLQDVRPLQKSLAHPKIMQKSGTYVSHDDSSRFKKFKMQCPKKTQLQFLTCECI